MFSREPSTVLRSSRGWRASAKRRPIRCSVGGMSVESRAANGVSRSASSVEVQSPTMYDSPKPILELQPSRWKNDAGRTIRITGESGPPRPIRSPPGNTTRTGSVRTARRKRASAMRARVADWGGVARPGQTPSPGRGTKWLFDRLATGYVVIGRLPAVRGAVGG